MSDEMTGAGNGSENGQGPDVRIQILGQYVKDLSFENPGAPLSLTTRPQIDLGVDLQARRMDTDRYEVELKLRVSATAEQKHLFLLELSYCGLLMIENVPDEGTLQQILLIEGPHLLFPFARRIVADAVRDGGMPPLMIEPIDFAGLYRQRVEQQAQQQNAPGNLA